MSDKVLFGEVRSLLHQPASRSRWMELTHLLDAFAPRILVERVIPYVNSSAKDWPDDYRVAPRRWIERLREGEEVPQLACAREIIWQGITNSLVGEEDVPELLETREQAAMPLQASDIMIKVDPLGFDGAVALERSGCLASITRLSLPRNQLERGGLRIMSSALAAAPNLRVLDLSGCRLGPKDMASLVSHGGFERLEVLDLENNSLDSMGARHLLSRPWPALKRLELSNNRISSSGLEGLEDDILPSLERLGLMGNPIGDDGVRWMCESGALSRLRHLDLADCSLHDGAARALASATHLEHLERLRLGLNVISPEARALITEQFPWL